MSILAWIILGLIVGFIASRLMGTGGYGLLGDIVVGVLGAVIGGWLATQFLQIDVTGVNLTGIGDWLATQSPGIDLTGVNLTNIIIGVVGAVILIVIFRALTPGRRGLAGIR